MDQSCLEFIWMQAFQMIAVKLWSSTTKVLHIRVVSSFWVASLRFEMTFTIGPAAHHPARGNKTSSKCWRGRRWWGKATLPPYQCSRSAWAIGHCGFQPPHAAFQSGWTLTLVAQAWPSFDLALCHLRHLYPLQRLVLIEGGAVCGNGGARHLLDCYRLPGTLVVWATEGKDIGACVWT